MENPWAVHAQLDEKPRETLDKTVEPRRTIRRQTDLEVNATEEIKTQKKVKGEHLVSCKTWSKQLTNN